MNFDWIVLPFDQEESNCLSTIVGANIHIVGERCWKWSFVWLVMSVRKPHRNWPDIVEVVPVWVVVREGGCIDLLDRIRVNSCDNNSRNVISDVVLCCGGQWWLQISSWVIIGKRVHRDRNQRQYIGIMSRTDRIIVSDVVC